MLAKRIRIQPPLSQQALNQQTAHSALADLDPVQRIWAVGAIHGEAAQLKRVHQKIAARLQPGDAIVYMGNYFGYGPTAHAVLEELLRFRVWFLSAPPYQHLSGHVFLHGAQEEMWLRLLHLDQATSPLAILEWMEQRGIASLVEGFGLKWGLARAAAWVGGQALSEWTKAARAVCADLPGYSPFMSSLKNAAYSVKARTLLVNSGCDPARPLTEQSDEFWWGDQFFSETSAPIDGFRLVVRGYDPQNTGIWSRLYRLNVDGGAGRGGEVTAALISGRGVALQWLGANS